jgi:NAD(P)-dependent dehydrogenase (short-subunit alcohol dehydrogenase family)
MTAQDSKHAESLRAFIGAKRYGLTEEIASLAAYLEGPDASDNTGASPKVDDGTAA